MSHYFNHGTRTPALDAAYLNPPGDRPMPKATLKTLASGSPSTGIFGPDWHKWRGATLHLILEGEVPFAARLEAVEGPPTAKTARLSVLDALGRPAGIRTIDWPPKGSVRIVRAP